MKFLIFHIIATVWAATLNPVSISATSLDIRTSTSYYININAITTIPSGGYIKIVFPSLYTTLASGSATCSITGLQTGCTSTCTFNGNNLKIENCFPQTGYVYITLQNINNPEYAATSSSFQIFTYDTSGNSLDDVTTGFQITFSNGVMKSASLVTGTQVTGDYSTWTVNFVTNYQIANKEYISVTFPSWSSGIGISTTMNYCDGVQTCNGIKNIEATPYCTCSSNTLIVTLSSAISPGSTSFNVTSVRNPYSAASVSGFYITTYGSLGVIDKSDMISISAQNFTPQPLDIESLEIDSPTMINNETKYTFTFSCSLPIPQSSILSVQFPSDLTVNAAITTSVISIWGISSQMTYSISSNTITINNGFPSYLSADYSIIFSVSNVLNPSSTKPTSPIIISVTTSSGAGVCSASNNSLLSVTATPGTLTSVSITPQSYTINADTTYSFSFYSSDPMPSGAGIKITLPEEMSVTTSSAKTCSYIESSSVMSKNSKCQAANGRYIYVTECFPSGYTSGLISFQIQDVINPMLPATTSTFLVETYKDNSFQYVIGSDSSIIIEPISGTLQSVQIFPANLITGESVQYTFIISTSNTIPAGGYALISLPSEILVTNINNQCTGPINLESTFSCQLTTSSIKIIDGFKSKNFSPGSFGFNVTGIMNPSTTKTSGTFKVHTYSGSYLIDSLITGITITSDTPHALESGSVATSNSLVGAYASFTFTLKPFNQFYNNGIIMVTPPSEITIPSSPSCSVGNVIQGIVCSLEGSKLKAVISLNTAYTGSTFSFILNNVQNPKTTKPSGSFTVTTMDDIYSIDSLSTGVTVQATTPFQLSSVSISSADSGINQVTTYTFKITTTYTIPAGGYIKVVLPSQLSITSTMKCYYSNVYVNCVNKGQNTINLYLFSQDFSAATLSFDIQNIKNYQLASSSSAFAISTSTSDGYSIESDSSQVVSFSCYSPCATCETTPYTCLSCFPDSSLPYCWNGGCHDECNVGYYKSSDNKTCIVCSEINSYCDSCPNGSYLYMGTCLSSCPSGITVISGSQCVACKTSCKTCVDTIDKCSSCVSEQILYNNKCYDVCPDGTIELSGKCNKCDSSCLTCSESVNNCTSCSTGIYLYSNACVDSCPENTTVVSGSNCIACKSSCLTCETYYDYCTLCSNSLLAFNGLCVDKCPSGYTSKNGACVSECSPGCNSMLLDNGVCDLVCNKTDCNYDNGMCITGVVYLTNLNYSTTLPISQNPLPASISGAASAGVIGVTKMVSPATSGMGASIGLLGIIEAASWIRLTTGVGNANSTHGDEIYNNSTDKRRRFLIDSSDDYEIEIGFSFLIFILFCHFVGNIAFTFTVYYVIIKKDSALKQWIKMHPYANALYLFLSSVISFKFIRFFISSFCGLSACSARLDKKTNIYKPILIMTYVSLGVVTIPILCVAVYLMSTFSTGNVVFLQALDTLIITASVALLHVFDLIFMHREIRGERKNKNVNVDLMAGITTPYTEELEVENFSICHCKEAIKSLDCETTTNGDTSRAPMDYWEYETPAKGQTAVPIEPESESFTPVKLLDQEENLWEKNSEIEEEMNGLNFSLFNHQESSEEHIANNELDATEKDMLNQDSSDINEVAEENFIFMPIPGEDFIMNEDVEDYAEIKIFGLEEKFLVDLQAVEKVLEKFCIEEKEMIDIIKIEKKKNSFIAEEKVVTDVMEIEETITRMRVKEKIITEPFYTEEDRRETEGSSIVLFSNENNILVIDQGSKNSTKKEFILVDNGEGLDNIPPEESHEIKPKEPDSSLSEPDFNKTITLHMNFELDDSSREFIDEENEPQLLEIIPEESLLLLSDAEVDEYDPECIRVQHRPSGLKVLVKQEFKGGEVEDGTILDTSMYEIHEIDEYDSHYAILRRTNSDTLIRVRRNFAGSRIVDVELRVGGRWMIGRVVSKESDFDFANAFVDPQDPECVIATHNVTGFKFRILKVFNGSQRIDTENNAPEIIGNYDPNYVMVDKDDVHYAWINYNGQNIRAKRNFVGGMILDILTDNEIKSFVFEPEQTAFFNNREELDLYVIPSYNDSQISSILPTPPSNPTEELFHSSSRKGVIEFLPPPVEESQEEPKFQENIIEEVGFEPEATGQELVKEVVIPFEEEKLFENVPRSNVSSTNSMATRTLLKFNKLEYGSDEEEQQNSRAYTSVTKRRHRSKKKGSRNTSITSSPENNLSKRSKNSRMQSQESLKNIEAIYLQRLKNPSQSAKKSPRKRFHNLMSPDSDYDSISMSAYESLSNLNMKPKAAELDIEMIRKKYYK
ncbi:unnamed protein product [Blepharisma stoltei]|uniref:TNFR-Cys domain-containing protein n=1 Tax=Blepharisma stoltei TaxID=1481888 RepID=A0AAU9JJL4_9CILI|nr:unnamed protein product [Blepharisma stoltei]